MAKKVEYVISLKDKTAAGLSKVKRGFKSLGASLKKAIRSPIALLGTLTGATLGLAGAFKLAGEAIRQSFRVEAMTAQFRVLIGSADEAKKHVQGLIDFAARTPFQLGAIGDASKQLMALTGNIMGSTASLEILGDAASAVGQPINDVATWVGRAYGAIKAGQPFGEASMRLMEMGILTGEARLEMEELQKAGASSAEVYGVLRSRLQEFSGGMEIASKTGEGLTSTLKDNVDQALAQLGDKFQGLAKDSIQAAIEKIQFLKDQKLDKWADDSVKALNKVKGAFSKFKTTFQEGVAGVASVIYGDKDSSIAERFKQGQEFEKERIEENAEELKDYTEKKEAEKVESEIKAREKGKSDLVIQIEKENADLMEADKKAIDKRAEAKKAESDKAFDKEIKDEVARQKKAMVKDAKGGIKDRIGNINDQLAEMDKSKEQKKQERSRANALERAKAKISSGRQTFDQLSKKDQGRITRGKLNDEKANAEAQLADLEKQGFTAIIAMSKAIVPGGE